MKKLLLIILVLPVFALKDEYKTEVSIHLNSIGFLPSQTKSATITSNVKTFVLKNATDHKTVFKGKLTVAYYQPDTDQKARIADFSYFTREGRYYLEIPGKIRSTEFTISPSVYHFAYYTCTRAFYLWRCGTYVKGEYNGYTYSHDPCHLADGYEYKPDDSGIKRNGTKGWHDAGDYGKYTVNAGITLGTLLMAWDRFGERMKNIPLDLPETAPGYPDFLKELKWETDWLLTMQYPDGSGRVSHKLTRKNFAPFIQPERDDAKRYFTDWSSAATANFAAAMAKASQNFRPYDNHYADICLKAAIISYDFLQAHPEYKKFEQGEFATGDYQSLDTDDRLWAAAELWETTGEEKYLHDFEMQATEINFSIDEDWDWSNVSNLGMFTYVLSAREGKNEQVYDKIKQNIIEVADRIVANGNKGIYRRPLGEVYYWGCNGTIARQVINLQVAYDIMPKPEYRETELDAIGHLFGRNFYNRSYITGMGLNPPMNPHDRRSGSDNIAKPWPGYLVGGGHSATGWRDLEEDYQTNEIAINWQAALVYALAGFLE